MAKVSAFPVDVIECPSREEVMTAYFDRSPVCFRIPWTLGSVFSVELLMDSSCWEDRLGSRLLLSGRVLRIVLISGSPYSQMSGCLETVERFSASIDLETKLGTMHLF